MSLAYIVSQGNITATIIWFAITTGATAGLSYSHERSPTPGFTHVYSNIPHHFVSFSCWLQAAFSDTVDKRPIA